MSRIVVVVMDIDFTLPFTRRRVAARSGEWAQHFSNASCKNRRVSTSVVAHFIFFIGTLQATKSMML